MSSGDVARHRALPARSRVESVTLCSNARRSTIHWRISVLVGTPRALATSQRAKHAIADAHANVDIGSPSRTRRARTTLPLAMCLDRSSRRTSRPCLRLGHAHSSLAILFSNARRVPRSLMGRRRTTYRGPSKSARPSRQQIPPPHWFHRILGAEPALVRDHNETGRGRRPRLLASAARVVTSDVSRLCRPKAALDTLHAQSVSVIASPYATLERHHRPRLPASPSVPSQSAVRDPCAIRARSCAQLEILWQAVTIISSLTRTFTKSGQQRAPQIALQGGTRVEFRGVQ